MKHFLEQDFIGTFSDSCSYLQVYYYLFQELPYAFDALEPFIDAVHGCDETVQLNTQTRKMILYRRHLLIKAQISVG